MEMSDPGLRGASIASIELGDGTFVESPMSELEPTEHGVLAGRTLIPWHRVARYSWPLAPQDFATDVGRARVRLRLADAEHVVAADRFETGPWTVTLVVDGTVDETTGEMHRRKLSVPWHAVLEVERLPSDEGSPERPDR